MTKILKINKWSEYQYPLPHQLMTQHQLLRALVKFRREVLKNVPAPLYDAGFVVLQLKVKSSTGEYRSISRCFLIKIIELTTILGELLLSLEIRSEAYNQMDVTDFIISYKIIESEEKIINSPGPIPRSPRPRKRLSTIPIGGYNLPRTMDLEEWGEVHWMPNEKEGIVYKYQSTGTYYFKIERHTLHVELRYRNKVVVRFRDELLNTGNLTEFKRTVRNHTYYFRDGELLFNSLTFTKPYIKPTVKSPFLNSKIITMDLETRNIDGKIYPYAVSIFDGEELSFFYLSDYADSDELLRESVKSLMQRRYHGYAVYLHNFSQFDGIFLVKILTELSSRTQIIMRESNIINVTFYFGRYHIYFRDSYLMLPVSLRVLAKQFNAPNKWIFPYRFANIVDLYYDGAVPEYKYFDGISQYQYNQYANAYTSTWNLRRETEFYCGQGRRVCR